MEIICKFSKPLMIEFIILQLNIMKGSYQVEENEADQGEHVPKNEQFRSEDRRHRSL